jgi:Fe-S-cluster containining protein
MSAPEPPASPPQPADQLGALAARVDAFFARVQARHTDAMQCRRGCAMCCQRDLRLLPVEWRRVAAAVLALPEADRDVVRAVLYRQQEFTNDPASPFGASEAAADRCALLAPDGSCRVFEARPLICRSHGLPIRLDGRRTTCALNFAGRLDAVPETDVLDQAQLSVLAGLIDRLTPASDSEPPAAPLDADGRVPVDAGLLALLG